MSMEIDPEMFRVTVNGILWDIKTGVGSDSTPYILAIAVEFPLLGPFYHYSAEHITPKFREELEESGGAYTEMCEFLEGHPCIVF